MFIREYTIKLLGTSFPNMSHAEVGIILPNKTIWNLNGYGPILIEFQVTQFVNGLFESNDLSTFKNHVRDFLVQSKEFSVQVCSCIHIFNLNKYDSVHILFPVHVKDMGSLVQDNKDR